MIRVLLMANDSLLAEGIEQLLAHEIDLDVVRITHQILDSQDPRSALIVIDEGQSENMSISLIDLFRDRPNFLVIMLSLKSRNIYVYESHQLDNPNGEQVIHLIKEFSRMNLKNNPQGQPPMKKGLRFANAIAALFASCWFHLVGRKSMNNVTLPRQPLSGFDP
jgi:hypothetical protein